MRRAIDQPNNVGEPKHDKRRTIPTSPALASALGAARRRDLWVMPKLEGGVLGYWAMLEALLVLYGAAKVPPPAMPFHSLRHTFGTELAARGVPVPVIRELMGHADVATTMRYDGRRRAEARPDRPRVRSLICRPIVARKRDDACDDT